LRFGVVREVVGERDPAQIKRLRDALESCFGHAVDLAIGDSYAALLQSFSRGDVQAAWLTPAMVVEASRRAKLSLVAGSLRRGSADYHSTLVVRADSGITRIDQLAERRAGWVDPWSAAGYLFPRKMLRDAKIDPTTAFSKQRFYSSHPAVLAALRDSEIDFCGTYLHHSGRLREGDSADGLVPLETSAAIPSDALCLGPHVPADEVARVEGQLVSDAAIELAATLQAQGFVKRALVDYALVRTLLDEEWGRTSNEPAPTAT
jgi:phosphate/phosphite/phosphonate ABC transporter binding protein